MKYNKLTPKDFKERLNAGEYETATGARRAVGKASTWKQSDRDKAYDWVNAHFGESAAPKKKAAKKAKKKKATKKKAAKKSGVKAKKKAKKQASKKKAATKATKKAAKKKGRRKKAAKKAASKSMKPKSSARSESSVDHELRRINLAGEKVGTYTQALQALEKAKQHGADVQKGVQIAADGITSSISMLENKVRGNGASDDAVAKRFAETGAALGIPPQVIPEEALSDAAEMPEIPEQAD